jgi:hypothetical protein
MSWIRVNRDSKTVWVNAIRVSYATEAEGSNGPCTDLYFEKDFHIVVDGGIEQVAGALREAVGVDVR